VGIHHSHLARRKTLCGHCGITCDSLYRETLRHCAYAVVPLLSRFSYTLPVHHIIQTDSPHLRTKTIVQRLPAQYYRRKYITQMGLLGHEEADHSGRRGPRYYSSVYYVVSHKLSTCTAQGQLNNFFCDVMDFVAPQIIQFLNFLQYTLDVVSDIASNCYGSVTLPFPILY